MTATVQGKLFDNRVVMERVEVVLQNEFCCYGYRNVLDVLKAEGWIINHKKLYTLMKSHHLLFNRKIGTLGIPRQFVRLHQGQQRAQFPFRCRQIEALDRRLRAAVHLTVDAVEIAALVGVDVQPDGNAAAAPRENGINELKIPELSRMLAVRCQNRAHSDTIAQPAQISRGNLRSV